MKEIIAYKCQCGEIYENKDRITTCKHCGKEMCIECSGFVGGLCWTCNDKYIEKVENIENDTLIKTEKRRKELIDAFEKEYMQMKELGQLL